GSSNCSTTLGRACRTDPRCSSVSPSRAIAPAVSREATHRTCSPASARRTASAPPTAPGLRIPTLIRLHLVATQPCPLRGAQCLALRCDESGKVCPQSAAHARRRRSPRSSYAFGVRDEVDVLPVRV